MPFTVEQKILLKHCDPAGIVFHPRHFEMMNDAVEAFFDQVLGVPFEEMHRTHGVPTVSIATEFRAPSRHGDDLEIAVAPTRVWAASAALSVRATCGRKPRFEARQTIVHLDLGRMRPAPRPDAARAILAERVAKHATPPAADARPAP